jgi:hypothetical protein
MFEFLADEAAPAETTEPGAKPLGSRWRFETSHWSGALHTGDVCTIVDYAGFGSYRYPYIVRFEDGGMCGAVDRELQQLHELDALEETTALSTGGGR